MSEKYYVCAGPNGCGKLEIGHRPAACSECGNTQFNQGLENLGFRAKMELAAHKRKQDNDILKKQLRLGGGKKR